jgi:dTDP-4-dehydrorhamnose 3,5-epimerase
MWRLLVDMIITETCLKGLYTVELEPINDERGFFARSFCKEEFAAHGLYTDFVQHNISYNKKKGTIRGMHYQLTPHEEIKLVRCVSGNIFDVAVDIRQDSKTYLQWFSIELNAYNGKAIYIPKGFAHGFQTLTDDSVVCYMMSEFYHKRYETGINWNDEKIKIQWQITENLIISNRDRSYKNI